MDTKICNECKNDLPLYNFNTKPGSNGKRYLIYICKSCQSNKIRKKNAVKKEMKKIYVDEKNCHKCEIKQKRNEFSQDVYQNDGLSKICRNCQAAYYKQNRERINKSNSISQKKYKDKNNRRKKQWALENKFKVRKTNQNYYKNNLIKIKEYQKKYNKEHVIANRNKGHRYRAKKRSNTVQKFTQEQLMQRMSVFGFKCAYCSGKFDHIDHVKPISNGGYHCLSNLRPSCKKCNQEKHNKSLSEWIEFKK